jgi:periplasmic divalent cation tolerance protein
MTKPAGPALVCCPFPDAESAADAISVLLDERLIACGNILPGMRSLYVWNGERGDSAEAGTILKTDASLLDRLIERLEALHPYDVPAITAWRCDAAAPATIAWLGGLLDYPSD